MDVYTYLNHLIDFWSRYWKYQLLEINEVVYYHNKHQKKVLEISIKISC